MTSKTPSPLLVWKILLLIVVIAIVAMVYIDPMQFVDILRTDAFADRLAAIRFEPDEFGVLFFGDSILRAALPPDDERISRALSQNFPNEKRVKAVNLAIGGLSARDLHSCKDQILALKPAVMILQVETILRRQALQPVKSSTAFDRTLVRLDRWARFLRPMFLQVRPEGPRNIDRRNKLFGSLATPAQVDISFFNKAAEQTASKRTPVDLWSNMTLSTKDYSYLISKDFIDQARAQGIHILIVETPVSETAAKLAPDGYLRQRKQIIRSLLHPQSEFYVQYPQTMDDENFKDFSHLKPGAQRRYFRWLAPVLAKRLLTQS